MENVYYFVPDNYNRVEPGNPIAIDDSYLAPTNIQYEIKKKKSKCVDVNKSKKSITILILVIIFIAISVGLTAFFILKIKSKFH